MADFKKMTSKISQEPTPREIYYFWGKTKALFGIVLAIITIVFFLGLYADDAKAGDPLFGVDLWLEHMRSTFIFTDTGKQNFAINVAKERLTELLELQSNDPELKLTALYELDKALVAVINTIDPADTEVISALQKERTKTAKFIAILQGIYTPPREQHESDTEDEFAEVDETAEYDDLFELGTSLIQSLNEGENALEQKQKNNNPIPTNTPIPTPTQPVYKPPTTTPKPQIPTATTTPVPPTPTPALGQAQETEFIGTLLYSNNKYSIQSGGTTYTVLNGDNYDSYVGQELKVHADLYSDNRIQFTEVEVND